MEYGYIILAITFVVGAYMAWNIGANDVANAMGTSVGSKAIPLRNAMIIAAIADLSGAFLVGPRVSDTIRGKIVDPSFFTGDMQIFVIGMLSALLASALWLHIATYLGWPVSTTHAIIGSITGFGLVAGGFHVIKWRVLVNIVLSWIISPLFGAVFASLVFLVILRLILFSPTPLLAAKRWIPWIICGTTIVLVLSIFMNGLQSLNLSLEHWQTALIALGIGAVAYWSSLMWMRTIPITDETATRTQKFKVVEQIFAKMQLASACYVAFAHGANDVANAIGPLAAVFQVAHTGTLDVHAPVSRWLLLFGGIFIALGTCTWGYKVIKTIGEKITGISPSRGFAAEFGAATTVLICSQLGMPVSTTHTIVGAVIGVGFARGMRALNLGVIRKIVESWVYTIPFSAALTAIIFYIVRAIVK